MPRYLIRFLAAAPILLLLYFTWWLLGWAYVVSKPYLPDWRPGVVREEGEASE